MSVISVYRNKQVHFNSSASRSTGTSAGVLYFNFAETVGAFNGIQKQTNSRVTFEYSGKYEASFFVYVGVAVSQLTYLEYGLNGNFIIIDEFTITGTNNYINNYSIIFDAVGNDFFELRVRNPGNTLFAANMSHANNDSMISQSMSIKKL